MTEDETRKITDPQTLKAVTHPLRIKMLGALRVLGPATASELGRRFGESSGSTSYHLRVLAKYGFVEEDPQQPNDRDKRWRAAHRFTSWNNADFLGDPDSAAVARMMRRRQLDFIVAANERYEADIDSWGPVWQKESGISDNVVRVRAGTLGELMRRIGELIDEYNERDRDAPGSELVQTFYGGFPLDESQIH